MTTKLEENVQNVFLLNNYREQYVSVKTWDDVTILMQNALPCRYSKKLGTITCSCLLVFRKEWINDLPKIYIVSCSTCYCIIKYQIQVEFEYELEFKKLLWKIKHFLRKLMEKYWLRKICNVNLHDWCCLHDISHLR